MKFAIEYEYTQRFLPTKRHRNIRVRKMHGKVDVVIKELTEEEFPVAFIIHEMRDVYEGMQSYDDYDNCKGNYKMFAEEIRTYKGQLRKPVRITHGTAISTLFEDYTYILKNIEHSLRNSGLNEFDNYPYTDNSDEFSENSIVIDDNRKQVERYIKNHTKGYIHFDGKFWSICNEPRYVINTFGFGHNHGGTGFFIEYGYNSNISNKNYFNALQRDEAIAYGKSIATRRGDTEFVERIGKYRNIEVIMPEMVKVNPNKQHGKGNKFLNDVEEIVNGSSDVFTAGVLCMALTAMKTQNGLITYQKSKNIITVKKKRFDGKSN